MRFSRFFLAPTFLWALLVLGFNLYAQNGKSYSINLDATTLFSVPVAHLGNAPVRIRLESSLPLKIRQVNVTFEAEGREPVSYNGTDLRLRPSDDKFEVNILVGNPGPKFPELRNWQTPFTCTVTLGSKSIRFPVGTPGEVTPDNGGPTPQTTPVQPTNVPTTDEACNKVNQIDSRVAHSIMLVEAIEKGDANTLFCILAYYDKSGLPARISSLEMAMERYQSNPLIMGLLNDLQDDPRFASNEINSNSGGVGASNAGEIVKPQSALLDGLNALFPPTEVIAALGKFTADRFKEELNIAFLERLRREIDQYDELKAFMPNSYRLLRHADMFNYNIFINDMREAFDEDLTNLDLTTSEFLRKNRVDLIGTYGGDQAQTLATAIDFSLLAYDSWKAEEAGFHPAEIIRIWGRYDFANEVPLNIQGSIQTLALISRNLEVVKTNNNARNAVIQFGWAGKDQMQQLGRTEEGIRAFLGFMYQRESRKLKEIMFRINDQSTPTSLWDLLQPNEADAMQVEDRIDKLIDFVFNVIQEVQEVQTLAANLENLRLNEKIEDYKRTYALYSSSIGDLIAPLLKGNGGFWAPNEDHKEFLRLIGIFLEINRQVNELVLASRNREYEKALLQAVGVLEKIYGYSTKTKAAPVLREFVQVGTFMTTVAQADSAEEILEILNAAALPVGSYSIKRSHSFSASLNAFVGGTFGQEYIPNSALQTGATEGYTGGRFAAFSAQVGVALNFGPNRQDIAHRSINGEAFGSGRSHTFFLSFIDIGAVTAVNLGIDSIAPLPNLAWQNVLAPGIHYYYGIPRTPIAVGVGFQYGPALRAIKNNQADIQNAGYRIQGGVFVDIPFFHAGIRAGKIKKKSPEPEAKQGKPGNQ